VDRDLVSCDPRVARVTNVTITVAGYIDADFPRLCPWLTEHGGNHPAMRGQGVDQFIHVCVEQMLLWESIDIKFDLTDGAFQKIGKASLGEQLFAARHCKQTNSASSRSPKRRQCSSIRRTVVIDHVLFPLATRSPSSRASP
jgi:hypothetical protein